MPGWSHLDERVEKIRRLRFGRIFLLIPYLRQVLLYEFEMDDLQGYFKRHERRLRDKSRRGPFEAQAQAKEDLVRFRELNDNDWYQLP